MVPLKTKTNLVAPGLSMGLGRRGGKVLWCRPGDVAKVGSGIYLEHFIPIRTCAMIDPSTVGTTPRPLDDATSYHFIIFLGRRQLKRKWHSSEGKEKKDILHLQPEPDSVGENGKSELLWRTHTPAF